MAHSLPDFLIGRRLFVAAGLTSFAFPALADVGPGLIKGALAGFKLAGGSRSLPDVGFVDAADNPLKLSDYKGKVILLNFWATWCEPCVSEMPSLEKLQATLGKDKFIVLPLSLDGPTRAKVVPFYRDKELTDLGIYFDKGRKTMQALGVFVLPTSILIDPNSREIGRIEGPADWAKPEAVALMKAAAD